MSPTSQLLIAAAVLLCVAMGVLFFRGQNRRGRTGGRISLPKIAWLSFAVFLWFLLSPIVATDTSVPSPVRSVVGAFAVSMWIRGVAELYMLYGPRNWRPPYGIAHDVFCIALIVAGLIAVRGEISVWAPAGMFWGFVALLLVSLVVEIAFAALFFATVKGGTTGKDGVWFADDDPRFARINRITTACVVPLAALTVLFLFAWARAKGGA